MTEHDATLNTSEILPNEAEVAGAASRPSGHPSEEAVQDSTQTLQSSVPSQPQRQERRLPNTGAGQTSGADGARKGPRPIPPALEQLASLYPQLFGAVFRPMKRGIFQELMAAHPELFSKTSLKEALAIHARSTRYLQAVASGQQRHDLAGAPVEDMAPEHIHHALVEVYKRRKGRGQEDMLQRLRMRIVDNMDASGLSREDYAALVRNRDEAANAVLDEALTELAERSAREEALLRTLEASSLSVDAFAEMYGIDRHEVLRSSVRARARLEAAQKALLDPAPVEMAASEVDTKSATAAMVATDDAAHESTVHKTSAP